ncbi:MAG: TonB-dependent receptor, partial [Gemmatimonas sp.]
QQLTTRWRHSLVAGRHWISGDREPFRSPLLPPRLPAGATFERADRRSLRYASTVTVSDVLEFSGGAETSVRRVDRELIRATVMNDLSALVAADLRARGAFAQTRVRIGSRFTLSGGARAERLSSVGPRQGIVWASTAGASWNRELPGATVRLRTAWGRGIRPPEPGMSVNRATSTLHQLANANLAPERQQGVEAGADLYFGNGAFFKSTWYQQFATDLLQQVSRRVLTGTADSYQFQNVGVVRNRGVEFEGGVRMGPVTVGANAQWPNSEVRSLSSRYTGELRPGDKLLEVPEAAGSAYARIASGPRERTWSAEVGVTALGPWTGYDWLLLARIEGGQATRRDLLREYWMRYPGVVRPYVSASAHIARELHAYLRVDNPGNNSAFVRDNASPTLGRTAMAGVEIRAKTSVK